MQKHSVSLALLLVLAACKSEPPKLDQLPPDSAAVSPAAKDSAAPVPEISSWKISPEGLGPLHAGMRLSEIGGLVPRLTAPTDADTSECTYARSPSLPVGAVLMLSKGTLVRVDVLSGRVQSDLGARIGDTEDQIKLLYGSSLKITPHKYTDGHYMTVLSTSDSTRRIVFETDGSKVIRFRSGKTPEVEYVEGCG